MTHLRRNLTLSVTLLDFLARPPGQASKSPSTSA